MNVNPGGKQKRLRNTVIPLSNPDPAPGEEDTHGKLQHMCFPDDHSNLELQGQPKGLCTVLMEYKSIWDKFTNTCKQRDVKPVGKCASCKKSQLRKDAEHWITLAQESEENASAEDMKLVDEKVPILEDEWCCMSLTGISHYSGYRKSSNGKFNKAKELVPQCLDDCSVTTIHHFFQKAWRYLDVYRYVLQLHM